MILTAKQHKKWAALVLVAAAGVGAEIGSAISGNAQQIDTIRASAVKACENSLKPGGVRFIVAQQIQQQIKQSQKVDYHKFFPNIPPGQLHALIQRQRAQQYAEVQQLLGVDCAAQFRG